MIKDIIEKIVSTEKQAEQIRLDADKEALSIVSQSKLEAAQLKQSPEVETKEQVQKILGDAEVEAQAQAKARLAASQGGDKIDAAKIDKAVKLIVEQYLKEV